MASTGSFKVPMKALLLPLILSFSLLAPFKWVGNFFHQPASVVEIAQASLVRITGETETEGFFGPQRVRYSCSAFQIAPNRVLTAAHCVGEKMLGDGHGIRVLKVDKYYDLALLQSEGKPSLEFRDKPVSRFEKLTAIGYAFGWTKLSTLNVTVLIENYAVQADAPVGIIVQGGYIGGMSGGPVVDDAGAVVSVVQRGSAQIGYGVSTLLVRAFLLGEDLFEKNPTQHIEVGKALTGGLSLEPIPFYER